MSRPQTPAGGRRPQAQGFQPLRSSKVISLEDWESNAPLSDEQLGSIASVREACAHRQLPAKFIDSSIEAGSSRPGTPVHGRGGNSLLQQALTNNVAGPSRPPSAAANGDMTSILTPQQFHDWFAQLTVSTEHEQDSLYRDHHAEISGYREACDALVESLLESEQLVKEMMGNLAYVEERSESLRGACENLLEEQTHLLEHTSQLNHRLGFFTFLERAQRVLHNPGDDLVHSESFLPMVQRLDECLSYLSENRDFKDAELYLIRYQQCMTRSMTLIKLYVVSAIRAMGSEVTKRVADKALSETATIALLYNKFASLALPLRALIAELEHRVSSSKDELYILLSECHFAWVGVRQSLLGSKVNQEIYRMNPDRCEIVELTRAGCSYLKQTCLDEFKLFKHFFTTGEEPLYGFLEGLCDNLYDHLRPRILHEPSLGTLCEVCTVIQALMVQDVVDDEDDDAISLSSIVDNMDEPAKPLSRLQIDQLLRMVLQDAQTRLVFRAQALVQTDVSYYVAKPSDLDYPKKLESAPMQGQLLARQTSNVLDDDDEDEKLLSMPTAAAQDTWYPTLKTTTWLLSCLRNFVDPVVFEDLAQEAVAACRQSLTSASDLVVARPGSSKAHGQLFLVRHLLILKEMTANVEMIRKDRVKEWTGMTDALSSLLANASSMLGYGPSVPSGREHLSDAKMDVDRELKRVCEELISDCSASATAALRSFLSSCSNFMAARAGRELATQEWASNDKVLAVHNEFKTSSRQKVQEWKALLMLYLQDVETMQVLLPPLQASIAEVYRQFHDVVSAEFDSETAATIMTTSAAWTLLDDTI